MKVWTIIPVKPLRLAKSRLSTVMSPEQRQEFAELMLRKTLRVVNEVPEISGSLVISRDSRALSLAREFGAKTVQESGNPELNVALTRATQIIASWGSNAVLILPADLPLITSTDLSNMLKLGTRHNSVVIATDKNQDGTNALFMRPPGLIEYAYGTGSFGRHIEFAERINADVSIFESENLHYDIDLPEDMKHFVEIIEQKSDEIIESDELMKQLRDLVRELLNEHELT